MPVPTGGSADPMGLEPHGIDPSIDPNAPGAKRPARGAPPVKVDEARAKERLTVGDRLFRAGEKVKATRRYEQSLAADPTRAAGYVRLAQVAIARGKYSEAADRFREAQAAEPGWLAFPPDVQNLFGEPANFDATLGALEAHLQANPDDRDAWLSLGAELFLSGRADRARDVFLRLTDRAPDATLRAFLGVTGGGE
jgi:tetratricopeptide (TPR) repeat protein